MLAELFLQTALTFLSREVPRWSRENHCYSCHNNGDAARALYLARARGYAISAEALTDTEAQRKMLGIAEGYDRLAQRAQERAEAKASREPAPPG